MRELERHSSDNQKSLPVIAIVGRGRVGRALARAASPAGLEVVLAGRRDAVTACEGAGAALLCVPDTEIEDACARIAAAIPPLRFVGHTSGATALSALEPARSAGAEVFSVHPLQTVPDGEASLAGAPAAISGASRRARELATTLATRLGMRPFDVPEESRAAYHAAACIASNFLVALEQSAADLMAASGIEDARELLAPLVLRTAENWSERGTTALTGPIARGDESTIEAHLDALAATAPQLIDLYTALAERTREIAAGGLTPDPRTPAGPGVTA
jgi:predicted short-subunit dehydrogenase-like oxidoreductase (DUF2520 family)